MRAELAARWPFRRLTFLAERSQPLDRVLRGAGLAMAIRVVGAALALLTQVALARWMGQFEYGVFLFAWSWVFLLALVASLGLAHPAGERDLGDQRERRADDPNRHREPRAAECK